MVVGSLRYRCVFLLAPGWSLLGEYDRTITSRGYSPASPIRVATFCVGSLIRSPAVVSDS